MMTPGICCPPWVMIPVCSIMRSGGIEAEGLEGRSPDAHPKSSSPLRISGHGCQKVCRPLLRGLEGFRHPPLDSVGHILAIPEGLENRREYRCQQDTQSPHMRYFLMGDLRMAATMVATAPKIVATMGFSEMNAWMGSLNAAIAPTTAVRIVGNHAIEGLLVRGRAVAP